jgi:MGT family glycosyltransferase
LEQSLASIGKRHGLSALRFTIQEVAKTTETMLREAPAAIRAHGVSMLLVDQTEPAGAAIAERLRLPFVTVCNALALNREADVPPPFTPWNYHPSAWARQRNRIGYAVADRLTRPIADVVGRYREQWNLKPYKSMEESFSDRAQISQQPALFDFPRHSLPPAFHYVGPLRKTNRDVPFPWDRLDGRPLIYASLGTLQNSRYPVFRCFAEACEGLAAQLVITHGGGLTEPEASSLPGKPIVVSYAPQLQLLQHARLTLTHAGLNTVLDSLTCGVPLIAIPITYEQPAIAQRIRYTGAGESITLSALNPQRLRAALIRVLAADSPCLANARRIGDSVREGPSGVQKAADIVLSAS